MQIDARWRTAVGRGLGAGLALVLVSGCAEPERVVLVNVRIVNPADGTVSPPRFVVVQSGRIIAVDSGRPPRGTRMDAGGGYAVPGLWDMHVHLEHLADEDVSLIVEHGVTGVREMGGPLARTDSLRARIGREALVGPVMLRAGPPLDGQKELTDRYILATAEQARAAVAELAGLGVDHLKVHNGPPREVFFALADEARRRGLPLVGHVPKEVDPAEAVDAGLRTVEHVATIYEGTLSRTVRSLADQLLLLTEYPRRGADTLARHFVERGAWFTPTLVAYASRSREPQLATRPDPRRTTVSPGLLARWDSAFPLAPFDLDTGLARVRTRGDSAFGALTAAFHWAGVPLLAGSDLGAREVYPGSSLVDELELLVSRAGLTPLEALRTATVNVADYLAARDSLGGIAPGMRADILILEANPLEDIANLRRVVAVVAGGRVVTLPVRE